MIGAGARAGTPGIDADSSACAGVAARAHPGGGLGDLGGPRRYWVSNPPYVPSGRLPHLAPEVRRESSLALDGGPDGLRAVRRVLELAGGEGCAVEVDAESGAFEKLLPHWPTLQAHPDCFGAQRFVTLPRPA